jgi:hypothetical protein
LIFLCIIQVQAGAGGTESMDWAKMVMQMYKSWAQRHGYGVTVVDEMPGEIAGIKVQFLIILHSSSKFRNSELHNYFNYFLFLAKEINIEIMPFNFKLLPFASSGMLNGKLLKIKLLLCIIVHPRLHFMVNMTWNQFVPSARNNQS